MQSSGPRPRRSVTPGRKPSNSASAVSTSFRTSSTPSGCFRSMAMERRFLASTSRPRPAAPIRSTRITSAPMSDSIMPQNGPGPIPASSMTRNPCNGPTVGLLARLSRFAESVNHAVTGLDASNEAACAGASGDALRSSVVRRQPGPEVGFGRAPRGRGQQHLTGEFHPGQALLHIVRQRNVTQTQHFHGCGRQGVPSPGR